MSESHRPAPAAGARPPEARILDHNYDGIREYDNPMPFWWSALLWGSVIFSVPYFFYYHVGVGPKLNDNFEREVGEFVEAQAAAMGDVKPDAATILSLVQNDPKLRTGASVMFRSNCATCHGPEGGGRTGPNLTDDSYLNIKVPEDIYKIISVGVVPKGMPEWGKRFSEPQVVLLASYVASLRGTKPVEAKEAQGTPISAWPTPIPTPDVEPAAAPAAGASAPAK